MSLLFEFKIDANSSFCVLAKLSPSIIRSLIRGSLGFFVVWVCYLGVNFLGKGLHSYGWLS